MGAFIDINDDHELYVWARTFRITPEEMARLVSEHGSSVERIREALKRAETGSAGGRRPPESSKGPGK